MLVIAPANTRGFSRTERDRQKILALWQDGFFAGRRAAEAVRDSGRGRHLPLGHRNSDRPPPIFQWAAVSSGGSGFAQEIRTAFCVLPYFYANFTKS